MERNVPEHADEDQASDDILVVSFERDDKEANGRNDHGEELESFAKIREAH